MDFSVIIIVGNRSMFMEVLVLGDTHIPNRARWFPKKVEEFLKSKLFDVVACTGDLTDKSVLDFIESLGKRIFVVSGNMDFLPLPERQSFKVENLRFGLIHGHQVYPRGDVGQLRDIAMDMGVDVLIHGHTHSADVHFKDVLLLNPGSATGVWSGGRASLIPSFIILRVEGNTLEVNLFELRENLRVDRRVFEL